MDWRLGLFQSPTGLVVIGALLLIAIIAFLGRRLTGQAGSLDPLGMDQDAASVPGASRHGAIHPDFRNVLDHVVLPRRQAHPEWERLDGAGPGIPGRTIARFDRNGVTYALNGETTFAAAAALGAWMHDHPGQDPFLVVSGKGAKGRLKARPETGWTDQNALRVETN